jgi:hypothetical protein
VTCLTLDGKTLVEALRRIVKATDEGGVGSQLIGNHHVAAGLGIPVALLIPGPFLEGEPLGLPSLSQSAAILIPTDVSLSPRPRSDLEIRGHLVLALSDIITVDAHGGLTAVAPAEQLLAPLRDALLTTHISPEPKRFWILPPDARWGDLAFDFIAKERVNVRFREQVRNMEPEHLGLKSKKNGKATAGWTFFYALAQKRGIIEQPSNPSVRGKVAKHKQDLSRQLKEAFGIDEEPIPWHSTESAYVARFVIRDETPKPGRRA